MPERGRKRRHASTQAMRHGSRGEEAYRYLKTVIVSADLPAGSAINEIAIAGKLGISRTPLREAVRRLEQEGLVVRFPNRGVFVRQLAMQEILEIWQIREWLEPPACQVAAGRIDRSALERLQRALVGVGEAETGFDSYETHHRIDLELHAMIVEATGNTTLKALLDGLTDRIRHIRIVHSPARLRASVEEHLEIIVALLAGDGTLAGEAMRKHLRNSRENLLLL